MATQFTDDQLRQIAEFIARRYLEVERGIRPRQSLRRYLSPEAYARQTFEGAARFGSGGVVRQTDIGQMVFQRPQPDRVHVAIPARQEGDRWGALVMEMHADAKGVWRVSELTRAQDRNVVREQPLRPASKVDADWEATQFRRTLNEARVAVRVASDRYTAARRDLAAAAPEKPAAYIRAGDHVNVATAPEQQWVHVRSVDEVNETGDVVFTAADGTPLGAPVDRPVAVLAVTDGDIDGALRAAAAAGRKLADAGGELARWSSQLQALEDEGRHLASRAASAERFEVGKDLEGRAYLLAMLGMPPTSQDARDLWDAAAATIETYRDRWQVTGTDSALGAQAEDPEQLADRDATIARLRELTSELNEWRGGRNSSSNGYPEVALEDHNADPFARMIGGRA